jgi:hypothetical protein
MNTSMRTRTTIALVVAGIMIPAASAVASPVDPVGTGPQAQEQSAGQSKPQDHSSVNALVGDGASQPSAVSDHNLTSLNAVVGGEPQASPSQSAPASLTSLNATVGAEQRPSTSQSAPASLTSLNATVGAEQRSSTSQSAAGGSDFSSVSSLVGDQAPAPSSATVAATSGDGFDWTDAMFGALAGIGLAAMMIAAAISVSRHRRPTAESRA